MRYDAVLFDLDGTLTASAEGIINCARSALDSLGAHGVPDEVLWTFIGPPLYESFLHVLDMDQAAAHEAVRLYRERYDELGWKENRVYPGIPKLLKTLKQSGAYLAIATAKPRLFTHRILEYFGLDAYFDAVSAVELHDMHASKEDIVRAALPPKYNSAVMIGDRMFDMIGAEANGIDGVGAGYGYGSREELEGHGAAFVADSVEELYEYLLPEIPPAKGVFITMEGVDASGKTTQFECLQDWLIRCGHELDVTREPGGCPISEKIRQLLLSEEHCEMAAETEMLLFAAARAQHMHQRVLPSLNGGKIVLCDRFLDSSVAYQGYGRELGAEAVMCANIPALYGKKPDLTLCLMVDLETSRNRLLEKGSCDRIEKQNKQFFERVAHGYREIERDEPERFVCIDANQKIENVAMCVKQAVMERLAADIRQNGD